MPRVVVIATSIIVALGLAGCRSDATEPENADVAPPYVQVTAGYHHSCGLTEAGVVQCWGNSREGQTGPAPDSCDDPVLDGPNCALRPVTVAGVGPLRVVDAGGAHTCGLNDAGWAFCWGDGAFGQLGAHYFDTLCGRNDTPCSRTPLRVTAQPFSSISAGGAHTCAIDGEGAAQCWGYGAHGRLGNGATENQPVPADVMGGIRFRVVDAGGAQTCGIALDGRAYCWGYNHLGQIGDGTTTLRTVPTPVQTTLRFDTLAVGLAMVCALTQEGAAWCWGANEGGMLGTGAPVAACAGYGCDVVPRAVVGGHTFSAISLGSRFACGVAEDGVRCWGELPGGELSGGSAVTTIPTHPRGQRLHSVDAGFDHACGLDADRRAWCWGSDWHGGLGGGRDGYESATPVRVVAPHPTVSPGA